MSDYLGGLQSAQLNQDATLFRRKYFLNGAHMGFIFYATDPNMDDDTEEEMKEMIASSKGVGNFRSMFVNIPDGKLAGIIPTNGGGGLGDPEKYDATYARNEVLLQCELIQDAINSSGLPSPCGSNFGRISVQLYKQTVFAVAR